MEFIWTTTKFSKQSTVTLETTTTPSTYIHKHCHKLTWDIPKAIILLLILKPSETPSPSPEIGYTINILWAFEVNIIIHTHQRAISHRATHTVKYSLMERMWVRENKSKRRDMSINNNNLCLPGIKLTFLNLYLWVRLYTYSCQCMCACVTKCFVCADV